MTAHGFRPVARLELKEVGGVGDARDHLAHVERRLVVGGHDAHQLVCGVGGARPLERAAHRVPVELVHDLAGVGERLLVVIGDVFAEPRHFAVQIRAAEALIIGVLADGGFDQRRAGEEDLTLLSHQYDVVGQSRQIGAAGGRAAVHHRDLRQARRAHARLVGEAAPAVDEDLGLVEQVRAAGLHQMDHRQLVGERDLLGAQRFLQPHGRDRAALDGAVARADDASFALNHPDPNHHAAARGAALAVIVVHFQPGQRRDLQEGLIAVDQARHALTRQKLAALFKALLLRSGIGADLVLQRAHLAELFAHGVGGALEILRTGVETGGELRHQAPSPRSTAGSTARWKPLKTSLLSWFSSGQCRPPNGAPPSTCIW